MDSEEENSFLLNSKRMAMVQSLSFHMRTNPYIQEMILVDADNNPYYANLGSYKNVQFSDLVNPGIREKVDELGGKAFWSETESSLFSVVISRQVKAIGDFTRPPLGQLYMFIDIEKLLGETLSQIDYYGMETAIHYNGEHFYSMRDDQLDQVWDTLNTKQYKTVKLNGQRHFAASVVTQDKSWEFLFLLPTNELFEELSLINTVLYSIYIALFLLFAFLIIRSSRQITSPITALAKEMKSIDEKDFITSEPLPLPSRSSDEVSLLYHEFYQMITKIDTLVNKNLKQQLSLNQSQLKALSDQLNPHFLYNTLDSLYWMAEMNKQPEMAALIKSLSALLRSSLNKAGSLITVKEQLDLMNDYFYIQKLRFKERLEFQIDVDHQLYTAEIPRFTLQPLVENSIKYSLDGKQGKCIVEISIQRDRKNSGLDILIRDNGPGLQAADVEPKGTGIGLSNLKQRIELLFGGAGYLKTASNSLGGTDVLIFVPNAPKDEL